MSVPAALSGGALLQAFNDEHRQYHQRQPVTAKTRLLGDELLASDGGVYSAMWGTR